IDFDRSGRGSAKDAAIAVVSGRYESQKSRIVRSCGAVLKCGALCRRKDIAPQQDILRLSQAFVAKKEEGVIFPDWPAEGTAKVIAAQRIHWVWLTVEIIARVKVVIAKVVEALTVEGICS